MYAHLQIQNNWTYGEMLDEDSKTHPMLRPYKTFSEKVRGTVDHFLTMHIIFCQPPQIFTIAALWCPLSVMISSLVGQRDLPLAHQRVHEGHDCMGVDSGSNEGRRWSQGWAEEGSSEDLSDCAGTEKWEDQRMNNRSSDQTEMMRSLNERYEHKYVSFRQHMTPAMATVPNQLKYPTWHCQESCRYDDTEVWTVRLICFTRCYLTMFFFLLLISHLPSQWQNNLQRTITTPGVERRRWSCSPKVRGHSVLGGRKGRI